jgi:twitching motility protein PilT
MSEIKNLITELLEYATEEGADLHICPKSAPFVRLGGNIGALQTVPGFIDWHLDLATVKALVGELLTPEQKNELLKNKYVDISYTHGELGRFRVSVYTQRGTHAVTVHTLPFEVPGLFASEYSHSSIRAMEIITLEKKGLIVVAGDCFAEKSELLAALVNLVNKNRKCHISTIESPIEYLHRHNNSVVVQKEIGADVADFGTALQQIRHENPDVVMISELRREDILSVMELAEERLVLTSVRTSRVFYDDGAECKKAPPKTRDILFALEEMTLNEADKQGLPAPFIPNPNITVLHRQANDDDIDIADNFDNYDDC